MSGGGPGSPVCGRWFGFSGIGRLGGGEGALSRGCGGAGVPSGLPGSCAPSYPEPQTWRLALSGPLGTPEDTLTSDILVTNSTETRSWAQTTPALPGPLGPQRKPPEHPPAARAHPPVGRAACGPSRVRSPRTASGGGTQPAMVSGGRSPRGLAPGRPRGRREPAARREAALGSAGVSAVRVLRAGSPPALLCLKQRGGKTEQGKPEAEGRGAGSRGGSGSRQRSGEGGARRRLCLVPGARAGRAQSPRAA